MNIYIDTPALFIRPTTNTDWRYMRQLHKLSEHVPVKFIYPFDLTDIIYENRRVVTDAFLGKIRRHNAKHNSSGRGRALNINKVKRTGAEIIYSHRHQLPTNLYPVPTIWFYSVADPRMLIANGVTESEIATQYEMQGRSYRLATKVQVTSDAEAKRHALRFPDLADRFVNVPWFRPGLSAVPIYQAREKHSDDRIVRLLFIGRQARRKGLDIILDAIRLLSETERRRLRFDIVSSFSDGPIDLDLDVDYRCHTEVDNSILFTLLRNAHVYAMPCRFETFGLVFVEAMSHGCAVLGPDWEVQQEILDYGRAGINAAPNPESVCAGLRDLCFNRVKRVRLAESGIERFLNVYSPSSVAASYMAMFESAVHSPR